MYLFLRIGHLKKIILKGQGFLGGLDEKMRRMWFGLEIYLVGLPPLPVLHPVYRMSSLRCFSLLCFNVGLLSVPPLLSALPPA